MPDFTPAPTAVVLGPQRLAPTLAAACEALALGVDEPVAVITAGWQEREGEHDELVAALARPAHNLRLHARADAVFHEDPALFAAHRAKQDRLKQLQQLYRRRLRHLMHAARELQELVAQTAAATTRELLAEDLAAAIDDVRRLDAQHLARVQEVEHTYRATHRPDTRPHVVRQRVELDAILTACPAIALAGGHVATILERLKLFDLGPTLRRKRLLAWSAGAMALGERIVLFHDRPPQGRGDAEVLHAGLGVLPGVVPLPHARHRLIVGDPARVSLLARRFAPATCVALDERCGFYLLGETRAALALMPDTHALHKDGTCGARARDAGDGALVPCDREPPGGALEVASAGDHEAARPELEVASAAAPPIPLRAALQRLPPGAPPKLIDALLRGRSFPHVDGNHVTFVYRGRADHVRLRHFIFGLPTAQPFHRVPDTDLWYFELELPPGSRVEYKLEVERGGHTRWIRDPLNPNTARDPFGANSVCQGAGYARPDWTLPDPEARPGYLEELRFASTPFGDARRVTVYIPARFRQTRRYRLLIVHDGGDYLEYSSLQTVLDNLIHRLEVAPMIVALTHPGDRLREYPDDPRHAAFIAEQLLPTLEERYPLLRAPASRGLMGASFGGVASLATAWRYPGVFGRLLLQSGSFAFTDIGDHTRGPAFDRVVEFVNGFLREPGRPSERVFVSCGTYESLIYENRSIVPRLQATGMDVRYVEARDGHNWENWRDRLRAGLSWLFPGPLWLVYE